MKALAAVIALFTLSACSTPQWRAAMEAKDAAPGRYAEGQCAPFAKYVAEKVPGAKVLAWQWSARDNAGKTVSASHAAVAWSVGSETWIMDNFSNPVWVGYVTTPRAEQVKQFFASSYRNPDASLPTCPQIKVTVARE